MEVICGSCGGRSKINSFGLTIVCPHCSEHLLISEEAAQNAEGPVVVSPVKEESPVEQKQDALEEAAILLGSLSSTQLSSSNNDADTQAEFVLEKPLEMVTEFPKHIRR